MSKKRVVILGAGPAGLSAAWKLAVNGSEVEVLESESQAGGLCKSIRRDGFTFDLGGHRFVSKDESIVNEVKALMGDDLLVAVRKSAVRLRGKYFCYPLGGRDLLLKMNPFILAKCFLDYAFNVARDRIFPKPDISLEDWVVKRFGRSLYNIYFGPYSAKLWGIPPSQISADWAAQRISILSLWDVFLRLFGILRDVPRTYAVKFYYPKKGIGQICERMAEVLELNDGKMHFNARVKRIVLDSNRIKEIIYSQNGVDRKISGDWFISTIPLPEFVKMLEPCVDSKYLALADSMRFRSLRFLNLFLEDEHLTDNTWTYIPEEECLFFRVQEPKNWNLLNVPCRKTSLILEIACDEGDDVWNASDKTIYERCVEDLLRLNLIKHKHRIVGYFTTKVKHAYPIYDLDYKAKVEQILRWLSETKNLILIGRQGLFRYNNMDHSIKMGFLASRHILEGFPKEKILEVASKEVAFEMER